MQQHGSNYFACRHRAWSNCQTCFVFLKVVILHIKLEGMVESTLHILSLHTLSACGVGLNGQLSFLNVVMLHIKLKRKEYQPL